MVLTLVRAPSLPVSAPRRLPNVQRAENEGQDAGSLDLSLHHRSEAPRQRLWSRGAEQGSGGDPSDPRGNRISIRYMPANPVAKAVLLQLRLNGGGQECGGEVIAVMKL